MPPILPRWQRQIDSGSGDLEGRQYNKGSVGGDSLGNNDICSGLIYTGSGDRYERESSDFQTSGFNSPRQSSDTLDTSTTGYLWDEPGSSGVDK
jgi:hypothetical protein